MNNISITIKAQSIQFYSAMDRAALFEWAAKIDYIVDISDNKNSLVLTVDKNLIHTFNVDELIGLFFRYGIDPSPLRELETQENSQRLRSPEMYWNSAIFGKPNDTNRHS